jgi:hypothetical protein
MSDARPLDSLGRQRSPAAVSGYLAGRPSRNKGRRYPADPPRTEEIIAVMRCAGDGLHCDRARGLIVVLWRAGLRIQEALDLEAAQCARRPGSPDHDYYQQAAERLGGRPSGRIASRNTPSPIMSPIRSHPGSRTEIRLGVRAHPTRTTHHAHAPPTQPDGTVHDQSPT